MLIWLQVGHKAHAALMRISYYFNDIFINFNANGCCIIL